ncbi:MAG TPA: amidase domain-containing protein [Pseudonocardiaceae bacterium]|nr:amidase domain-containing protein [Pseudonocardiaceae bacterium]
MAPTTAKTPATDIDQGTLAQVLPLAQRYLESRAAVFTGRQPGAAVNRWVAISKRDVSATVEIEESRRILAADGVKYADATVRLTNASVQRAGDGVALRVTESTTLTPPAGSSLPASTYAAERVFILQPRDGSWYIADQKLVNGGAIPPMTEPVSEYVPAPVEDSPEVAPLTNAERADASSIDQDDTDPVEAAKNVDSETPIGHGSTEAAAAGLNYKAAVAYADKYWRKPGNTYFVYISENGCANFVSQAMQAGGWRYVYGDRNSDRYWYYGTPCTSKASLTFINTTSLYRFAKRRASVLKNAYDARDADIIMFDDTNNGVIGHSMIVTGWDKELKTPRVKSINKRRWGSKTKYYALRT